MTAGTIVRSFATPTAAPRGICFDGRWLLYIESSTDLIHQIDIVTERAIKTIPTPGTSPIDIVYDGDCIWDVDLSVAGFAYKLDRVTGSVRGTIPLPASALGITFDGHSIWTVDGGSDTLWQLDPITGAVKRTISTGAQGITSPRSLTWDGKYFWICDNGTDSIYQFDPVSGTVVQVFAAPAATPVGLAWDGRALWHTNDTTDTIYQISTN